MAISRAQLLKELLPGLNELFGTEYEHKNTWAVFAERHNGSWKIEKIERWLPWEHGESMRRIHKITDATDEMDAYKKFMEQTK